MFPLGTRGAFIKLDQRFRRNRGWPTLRKDDAVVSGSLERNGGSRAKTKVQQEQKLASKPDPTETKVHSLTDIKRMCDCRTPETSTHPKHHEDMYTATYTLRPKAVGFTKEKRCDEAQRDTTPLRRTHHDTYIDMCTVTPMKSC